MENAKNYNNLKHLEAPSICKNLFSKDEPEDSANVYNEPQPKLIQISSFSRKVFIGGLPPDIDKSSIAMIFGRFGTLIVDWPHQEQSNSLFPPKGYVFLIFDSEESVIDLLQQCHFEENKFYVQISSPSIANKMVQVRPWSLADSDCTADATTTLDPRLTVFVGGIPRPLKAAELAFVMDRAYKNVCYAGIDTDQELKYPKGAGRVVFSDRQSYIAALSNRYFQLQHEDMDKRIEVKPFILDGQICDECEGLRSTGPTAFCASIECLRYYCDNCWLAVHDRPGGNFHKPLIKGSGRPRAAPFRYYH